VLHKHLSCEVAAGIVKHQKGVSALAQVGEGLKRELWHAEAAQVAKKERRRRKKRALQVRGGSVYSQDARKIVQQQQVNDISRLETELTAKRSKRLDLCWPQ
jgi:hypothetical protein